jgi:RING finger protein 113A
MRRARREAVLRQAVEGAENDGTYKGMNDYIDYRQGFRREHTIGNEKGSGTHGPLRASSNVRMTVRFDYQPDICKDYKETGFCGYGDACKFIHDRSDYKSGWELERVRVRIPSRLSSSLSNQRVLLLGITVLTCLPLVR